jgi:hypothetical protein
LVDLFQELHSWDQNLSLGLNLGIRGCQEDPAPELYTQPDACPA